MLHHDGLRRAAVPAAFDDGARSYDRLVGLNPGYHAHLRLSAERLRLPGDGAGLRLLDAGCGTGASAAALLAVAPRAEIVAIDVGACWRARVSRGGLGAFRHTSVRLAACLLFDGILPRTRACRRSRCPASCAGPAAASGATAVHGTQCVIRMATMVWHAVCWGVIIPLGWLFDGDTTLYRHLWRSVTTFDGVTRFRRRLADAGFTAIHSETMTGWQRGVVHTFLASVRGSGCD